MPVILSVCSHMSRGSVRFHYTVLSGRWDVPFSTDLKTEISITVNGFGPKFRKLSCSVAGDFAVLCLPTIMHLVFLLFTCSPHLKHLDCKPRQRVSIICVYVYFRYSSSKLVHLFTLHCFLHWTSSNCVNIVIYTLKFISIINLYLYFHLLLFVQELYSKGNCVDFYIPLTDKFGALCWMYSFRS